MKNKELKKGYVLMLLTVIIWGADNVLQKSLLNLEILPMALTYLRLIFATISVQIILLIKKEKYSKEIIDKNYKKQITTMGILLSIFYMLSLNGLKLTKAVLSEFVGTVITTMSTIIILAIFIKEERKELKNKYTIIALLIAIIGTLMTALGDIRIGFDLGIALVIIADIIWGFYIMVYNKIDDNISAIRINRDLGIVAIIIYTIILLATKEFFAIFQMGVLNIFKILIVTLFVDVGTILTYYVAIRIITGIKASILSLLSPIIAFALSYIWLGERIVFIQLIGCFVLFLSSVILVIKDAKQANVH